ncbi:MAG: hypothetical protein EAZ34_05720 [Polaromonas sp.]|nr:MAG: hypothetical protein EAZ34_05720 [Polaromonas sp.]
MFLYANKLIFQAACGFAIILAATVAAQVLFGCKAYLPTAALWPIALVQFRHLDIGVLRTSLPPLFLLWRKP